MPAVLARRFGALAGAMLLVAGLMPASMAAPARATAAAPTELFFSEYIEGSSNNKALEVYNGTGASVNLGTGGYNVQMYFNGSAAAGLTINLTGTVATGDVFVLAQSSANATILAQADQTSGAGWFNGNDAVVLRKGMAVIDAIGQIGVNPGTEWGSGLTSTADNTLRRKASIAAGDTNGSDAFDPSVEWDVFATDTLTALGFHPDSGAPAVASTSPANGAGGVALGASIDVTFSEPVNLAGAWFTLTCSVSGARAAAVSGGPTTFTIDPIADFEAGDACTLTVAAGQVSDQDSDDPPDTMAADSVATFNTIGVCDLPFTPIYSIQGSGSSAAITGVVTTQGVVVGDFEGSAAASGFYLQDLAGDGNPATSDGIFVFTGSGNLVSAGQVVRVTGYARERFNQTTLNGSNSNTAAVPAANIVQCGTGSVAPTDVTMPFADANFPERFEGMSVRFPQPLVIAEYYNYDRFGEIVLAQPLDGESRPFTGTAIDEPGAPANARTAANSLRRITLDDAQSAQNPPTLRHPNGDPFSLTNRFRGGDLVQDAVGVLGYDFSLYRIIPTGPADYTAANPRPTAPDPVGGTIRAAAMNTLNYFVTADYPTGNPLDNKCGPLNNVECRGWDSDQTDELTRQRTKLLAALAGLDADIIGLNELENSAGVEPLASIVSGLPGYAYIDTGTIGSDAIRVGLIYRPAKVTPVGSFQILDSTDDPRFIDTKSRPVLAQTFQDIATGARFTVAVNHLKSKGSDCNDVGDPDLGDGQGNCSATRTLAAQALVDWLATDPTGSGDPDVLILGDLNSYAMEDPIDAVKAGADDVLGTGDDYTDLIPEFQGAYAYSYTFDGQAGYLDHAMASASLVGQATGTTVWHINSDEPDVLDYDTSFKPPAQDALYEPNAYRSSDHDPVLVGLNLVNLPPVLGEISVTPNPVALGTAVSASVSFTDPDGLDTHTATWDWGDDTTPASGIVTEAGGTGTVTGSHFYAAQGVYTVTVTVDDGWGNAPSKTYEFVAVYDPNGPFVTGGGWFSSQAGTSKVVPAASGRTFVGFVSTYLPGASVPSGSVRLAFHPAGLDFRSTSLSWMVVTGSPATARTTGVGTLNGEGGYTFDLRATDDKRADRVAMTIWDSAGDVVYSVGDRPLTRGSVIIRKAK
jgi:predicted extracellular nuclease